MPILISRDKKKTHKLKKDDRVSISKRILWRFFGLMTETMGLMKPRESDLSQTLVMPRWMTCVSATRTASPSATIADATYVWNWAPKLSGIVESFCPEKTHPRPADLETAFRAASVLQRIASVGIGRVSGKAWSFCCC